VKNFFSMAVLLKMLSEQIFLEFFIEVLVSLIIKDNVFYSNIGLES